MSIDDSPRSAKRRKVDTPISTTKRTTAASKRVASTSKAALSRPTTQSGQQVVRNGHTEALEAPDTDVDQSQDGNSLPKSSGKAKQSRTNGEVAGSEEEVYDDIEGALDGNTPSRKSSRQRKPTAKVVAKSEDLQSTHKRPSARTPNSGRGRPKKSRHAGDADDAAQDPLENVKGRGSKSARKSKGTQSMRGQYEEDVNELDVEELPATPSRSARTKRPLISKGIPIPDSEQDELLDADLEHLVSSPRKKASTYSLAERDQFERDEIAYAEAQLLQEQAQAAEHDHSLDFTPESSMDQITLLKSVVLERMSGKRPVPLIGLDDEYAKVYQLVEQTVTAGEGNSMLLIGSRGSGKTALVNKVLRELSQDQREFFHIVRLNGFIQTDDKLALREIWRQLGREMDIDDDAAGKNYADTLSTLLAFLSHPSELATGESDQVAKAVIFIMDEFDLFASHPRQTLLYNLFDIAQSRKAPIAVLGLTTKINVTDSLEKRVKSRFSHRYVHLPLAKGLNTLLEMCKAALGVLPADLSLEERAILSRPADAASKIVKKSKSPNNPDVLSAWNSAITSLLSNESFIKAHVSPTFHLSKSLPTLLSTTFLLPISTLSPSSFPLTASHFTGSSTPYTTPLTSLTAPFSSLTLLPSLSDLALALLIASARLSIIHSTPLLNFNMAYAEYVSLSSRARISTAASGALAVGGAASRVWGREVARGEWERLVELGMLIPVLGAMGAAARKDVGPMDMVRVDVALEEIVPSVTAAGGGMDRVMERWCKQL